MNHTHWRVTVAVNTADPQALASNLPTRVPEIESAELTSGMHFTRDNPADWMSLVVIVRANSDAAAKVAVIDALQQSPVADYDVTDVHPGKY